MLLSRIVVGAARLFGRLDGGLFAGAAGRLRFAASSVHFAAVGSGRTATGRGRVAAGGLLRAAARACRRILRVTVHVDATDARNRSEQCEEQFCDHLSQILCERVKEAIVEMEEFQSQQYV